MFLFQIRHRKSKYFVIITYLVVWNRFFEIDNLFIVGIKFDSVASRFFCLFCILLPSTKAILTFNIIDISLKLLNLIKVQIVN